MAGGGGLTALDLITILGFWVDVKNYEETLSQSDVQKLVQDAVDRINGHLEEQDRKLEKILDKLEGM